MRRLGAVDRVRCFTALMVLSAVAFVILASSKGPKVEQKLDKGRTPRPRATRSSSEVTANCR